jgi:hypothetical protein
MARGGISAHPYAMNQKMKQALTTGDFKKSEWPGAADDHIPPYLGSGRMGASFDAWGLTGNGFRGEPVGRGLTVFMHSGHFHRGRLGIQSRVPVGRLVFSDGGPGDPNDWSQEWKPASCSLTTTFTKDDLSYEMKARFDPSLPDLFLLEVRHTGPLPDLLWAPVTEMEGSYGERLSGEWASEGGTPDFWRGSVRCGSAHSAVGLRVVANRGPVPILHAEAAGVRIGAQGPEGRFLLVLAIAPWSRREALFKACSEVPAAEVAAARAEAAWEKRFGDAYVELGDRNLQALWARSLAYVLYSYAPDVACPAPPCGWSGNLWGYTFPQDLSYIHPALLRLGHTDIARSWVEFFSGFGAEMERFTARIWKRPGTFWAWEFPVEPGQDLLDPARPGEPNWYQYEIHNASTVVRMAVDTARALGDDSFTREVVLPMVLSTARFYASGLVREKGGTWGLFMEPSMGQDEMGGHNQRNYLCGLFAAEYTLRAALELLRQTGREHSDAAFWAGVLRDGLAYDRLLDPSTGLCANDEGGGELLGRQKHPVQVNPLMVLPFEKPHDHAVRAYRSHRMDLCKDSSKGHFYGWTLWAYLVAAAHDGDGEGLGDMTGRLLEYHAVDKDRLQIYETSISGQIPQQASFRRRPWVYYVTSHGFFMQAVQDAFINDFQGRVVKHGAVPRSWGRCRYEGLRTAGGQRHSGEVGGA